MNDLVLQALVAMRAGKIALVHRLAGDDRGEGVISTAIAVLVMAFIGVAMWIGFNSIFDTAETTTREQVERIGQ